MGKMLKRFADKHQNEQDSKELNCRIIDQILL